MSRLQRNLPITRKMYKNLTDSSSAVILLLALTILCLSGCRFISYNSRVRPTHEPAESRPRLLPGTVIQQPVRENEPIPARQQQGMEPQG